jgi:PKHD-type hydroxylase
MLIHLKQVLTPAELRTVRARLQDADWIDGRATAGSQSASVKHNRQLPTQGEASQALRPVVLDALNRYAAFFSAALPKKILPPLFNRYDAPGGHYGPHVDGAVLHGGGLRVRADLSCTLFLSGPDDYDGGALAVRHRFGSERIRLPAGDALLYSSGSVHGVEPVTRGTRLASFFWIESLVRGEAERGLLQDLDDQVRAVRGRLGECDETVALAGTYHNLLRLWADT